MYRFTCTLLVVAALSLAGCSKKEAAPETPTKAPAPTSAPTKGDAQSMLDNAKDAATAAVANFALASLEDTPVKVGCGLCTFHMDGVRGCKTAVEYEGVAVLVEGEYSNAHSMGLCSGPAREGVATGTVEDGKVTLTSLAVQ